MSKFASPVVLVYQKEKEGPTPKNKSKLFDIPISHFSSIEYQYFVF